MILDSHIHIYEGPINANGFHQRLTEAGVDGGVMISIAPPAFYGIPSTAEERLENLFAWVGPHPRLFPFYWIDPLEADALGQVEMAVAREVVGFKVICDRFFPGDDRALPVYRTIADAGKPMLFHSGILWDGKPSSKYNRPAEFEALLEISGLRFALAHIGWPWYDELIAVYGKFLHARRHANLNVEMFIDTTPGTPPIYRRDALTKVYTVGYDVTSNVLFGTDNSANNYSPNAADGARADAAVLRECGVNEESVDAMTSGNLLRFLGLQ